MNELVFLKESDLRRILREELATVITPTKDDKEHFSIDEAVEYLRAKGYKISKATLYVHTSKGTIDFHRFGGRKLVFTQKHLDDFLAKMKH
ncbi:MAG: helix-turn-helix domain-containing protein [Porphyromonadaceae bacterium]|nr:helix-turn-helix domain-containing protein [Porphyromonadaceae bacterium]